MPLPSTHLTFRDELPRLLRERSLTQRELARRVGVNPSYITFVLNAKRAPSRKLLEATARALDLPPDYFRETRESIVLERLRADPPLLDRVYRLVTRAGR